MNRGRIPHLSPRRRLLLAVLLLSVTLAAQAGWPRVPEPPLASMEQIGGNTNWNTVPMRVSLFHSKAAPERVLAFYRDRWSDGFVEDVFGPWQQISRKEDEYFITIQVQPDDGNGSHGRISIMHLHDRPVEQPGKGVPMMRGSSVFNDFSSTDAGRRARTVALFNDFSVQSNYDYYRRHYVERGWGMTMNRDMTGMGNVAVYRKGGDEVTVVINRTTNGTTVLLNEVRSSGFFSW